LFLDFVKGAFGVDPRDTRREKLASLIQRHGGVDALSRDLVFEFKRDLDKERKDRLRFPYTIHLTLV
jgi:hypothetical protein